MLKLIPSIYSNIKKKNAGATRPMPWSIFESSNLCENTRACLDSQLKVTARLFLF